MFVSLIVYEAVLGLKEVSEGILWAVREIIVQIKCDRKDTQWVKNVDEVADRVYRVAYA